MTFADIERVTTKLNLIHKVNMDELYDECSTAKPILKRLKEDAEDEWKSKGVAARWVALFRVADLPNMLFITRHILSIPASTGCVERIFSRMANKWSDCRNKCSTELMRNGSTSARVLRRNLDDELSSRVFIVSHHYLYITANLRL
ncbi:unnamed protein product [Boreogadus saida]